MTKHCPAEDREKESARPSSRRKSSITLYLIILFAVAFLLLVLAYFMQERAYAQTALQLMACFT